MIELGSSTERRSGEARDELADGATSAVIERGSDAAPVVWYAAGNLDITDELIKAYNAQSSAGPAGLPHAPRSGTPAQPTHPY
jgi:hypothetical protein